MPPEMFRLPLGETERAPMARTCPVCPLMTKADMTTIQNVVRFPKGSPLIDWIVLFLLKATPSLGKTSSTPCTLNTTMI